MKGNLILSIGLMLGLLIVSAKSKGQNVFEGLVNSSLFSKFSLDGLNFTNNLEENPLLDKIVLDIIPRILGYPPLPTLPVEVYERNRRIALSDTSNDEIFKATAQEILVRSGFEYENHYSLSDDGYITQLIRIVNPLADRKKLRQPPVLLFHGAATNPASYLSQSAIQHHPERFPRTPEDGPITSSNRSLGFMLANNGWDVWLIETRGSEQEHQEKIRTKTSGKFESGNEAVNLTQAKGPNKIAKSFKYWNFSLDELIEYEFENQVDKVREVTGSEKVSIFTYSISTLFSLPKLGMDREFAVGKVHNYIALAVPINYDGATEFSKQMFIQNQCLRMDDDLGTLLVTDLRLTQAMRTLMVNMSRNKFVRYLFLKFLYIIGFGTSAKYNTFLELPLIGRLNEPTSFRELKHSCQQLAAGRSQKFDFESVAENKLKYGQGEPPIYNISNIHVKNWLYISLGTDNVAPSGSTRQILKTVKPKPYKHLQVPNYNHVDAVGAFDNDIKINMPILKFLNKFQLKLRN